MMRHGARLAFSLLLIALSTQGHVLEFTVEPRDTVVESGQSAILDCVVRASHHQSSVLIQWLDQDRQKLTFVGDTYRSQLTNGSLYLTAVLEDQGLTGTYQCMATLPNVGSIVSRTARLDIATLSGFDKEPSDLTVYVGQKAHFACHIRAHPRPRMKWLKDERPLHVDEVRMTLLPSGALEIDDVIESDQGTYRCNATGLQTYKLSNRATLTVDSDGERAAQLIAPMFIARPRSQVVVEGQNVSLDCAANGNPNPTVTWLKDGREIDMKFLDSSFSMIGSTKSLSITNVKEEDAGTYQCRAGNREDSLDASAVIQVQVPPRFLVKPLDKIESMSRDIVLECKVYGVPPPDISWYKNGEVLKSNSYYTIDNENSLKILGLMLADTGIFQCFATNPAGNIQAAASVKVLNPETRKPSKLRKKHPHFDKTQSIALFSNLKPDSTDASLGDVDFGHRSSPPFQRDSSASASSTSNKSSRPFYNFDPLSTFTSLKSSESGSDMLGLTQNAFFPAASSDTTHTGRMRIEGVPGRPTDLRAQIVKARFVVLSWTPPSGNNDVLTYAVFYRQEGSERERMLNTTKGRPEELSVPGLEPGRVYHFRVAAINSKGIGDHSESLSVTTQSEEHVASAPQEFHAFPTSPRSIHVRWKAPEVPNGVINRYTVYYMETSSSIEHNIDTTDLKYDLIGLLVYTEYSVWVVAVNENGPGSATEERIVRTFGMAPSKPPANITFEPLSTSVTVRWEPPQLDSQNGIITGYKVRYRKHGQKGNVVTTPADARSHTFGDLERASKYQFRVWAINLNGTSPPSEWYDVETYENDLDESRVPEKPGPLQVRPTSDKLYVMWTPPTNQNIKIRNYILGWGKVVPEQYEHELDEKTRGHVIAGLEPNSEYVLSLRASNAMGPGQPVYANIRTQEEPPPEPQPPLLPPVGLKAQVLSPTSMVLYWTDTTLKSQVVRDNRYYIVKYTDDKSGKSRVQNVTDLNVVIDDLKPSTAYEFTVKLVKGRKESPWSMVAQNVTYDSPISSAPRDLDVHLKEDEPQLVELTWQPPKVTTGRITGYIILYTDNKTKNDREWKVQAIKGDRHSAVLDDLNPFTEYYFKVQARNSRGNGPFSNVVIFTTGQGVSMSSVRSGSNLDGKGIFSSSIMMYLLIGGCILAISTIAIVTTVLCCRRREVPANTTSPDRSKKGYQKGSQGGKQPPDLWIHHDQMELKNMEKIQSNQDGASGSGTVTMTTLTRSGVPNDYETHHHHPQHIHEQTNSLDKRTYVPNYMGRVSPEPKSRPVRSKPSISLPVDSIPPREPIATPINAPSIAACGSNDSTPSGRPSYPRTQYSLSRAHVTMDPAANQAAITANSTPENPYSMHSSPQSWIENQPPSMSILNEPKRIASQGHPLKSFTVPAPPPVSAPGTPKHIVTVRPNSSPYRKPSLTAASSVTPPPSRINSANPPPHTLEEVQKLQPSHSTEELNQEMANLEGLMLTLNAITANQFEC